MLIILFKFKFSSMRKFKRFFLWRDPGEGEGEEGGGSEGEDTSWDDTAANEQSESSDTPEAGQE